MIYKVQYYKTHNRYITARITCFVPENAILE